MDKFYTLFKLCFSFWFGVFVSINFLRFFDLISFVPIFVNSSQTGFVVPITYFTLFFLSSFYIGLYFFDYVISFFRTYWATPILISAGCSASLGFGYQHFFEHAHWDVVCFVTFFYILTILYLETRNAFLYLLLFASTFIFFLFVLDPFGGSMSVFNDVSYKMLQPYGSSIDYGRPYYSPALKWVDESKKLGLFNEYEWWTQYFKPFKAPDPTLREFRTVFNNSANYPKRSLIANTYVSSQPGFVPSSKLFFFIFFSPSFLFSQYFFARAYNRISPYSSIPILGLHPIIVSVLTYLVSFLSIGLLVGLFLTLVVDLDYFLLIRENFDFWVIKYFHFRKLWSIEYPGLFRPQTLALYIAFISVELYLPHYIVIVFTSTALHYLLEDDYRKLETEDHSLFIFQSIEKILYRLYPSEHWANDFDWLTYYKYLINFRDFRRLFVSQKVYESGFYRPLSYKHWNRLRSQNSWRRLNSNSRLTFSPLWFWTRRNTWFLDNDFTSYSLVDSALFPSHILHYRSIRPYVEEIGFGAAVESAWSFFEYEHDIPHYDHFTGEKFIELGNRHQSEFSLHVQSKMLQNLLSFTRTFSFYSFSEFKILTVISRFVSSEQILLRGKKYTSLVTNMVDYNSSFSPLPGLVYDFVPNFNFKFGFSPEISLTYSYFGRYFSIFSEFFTAKLINYVGVPDLTSDGSEDLFTFINDDGKRSDVLTSYQSSSVVSAFSSLFPSFPEFLYSYFNKYSSKYTITFYSSLSTNYYDVVNSSTFFLTFSSQFFQLLPWYMGGASSRTFSELQPDYTPGESQLGFFLDVFENISCSFFSKVSCDFNHLFLSSNSDLSPIPSFEDYVVDSPNYSGTSFDVFAMDLLQFDPNVLTYPDVSFYDLDKFLERGYYLDLYPFKFKPSLFSIPKVKSINFFSLTSNSFSNVNFSSANVKSWLNYSISDFVSEKQSHFDLINQSYPVFSQFPVSSNNSNRRLSTLFAFSSSVKRTLSSVYPVGLKYSYFLRAKRHHISASKKVKNPVSYLFESGTYVRPRPPVFLSSLYSFIDYFVKFSSFTFAPKSDVVSQYEEELASSSILSQHYEDFSRSDYLVFLNFLGFSTIFKRSALNNRIANQFASSLFEPLPFLSASSVSAPDLVLNNFSKTARTNSSDFFSNLASSSVNSFCFARSYFNYWCHLWSSPADFANQNPKCTVQPRIYLLRSDATSILTFPIIKDGEFRTLSLFERIRLTLFSSRPQLVSSKFSLITAVFKHVFYTTPVLLEFSVLSLIIFIFIPLNDLSFIELELFRIIFFFYAYSVGSGYYLVTVLGICRILFKLFIHPSLILSVNLFYFFQTCLVRFKLRFSNRNVVVNNNFVGNTGGVGVEKSDPSVFEKFSYTSSLGFLGYSQDYTSRLHGYSQIWDDSDVFFIKPLSPNTFSHFWQSRLLSTV